MSKKKSIPIKKPEDYFSVDDINKWSPETLKKKLAWSKVWTSQTGFKNKFIWLQNPTLLYIKDQDKYTMGPIARDPYSDGDKKTLKISYAVPDDSKTAKLIRVIELSLIDHIKKLALNGGIKKNKVIQVKTIDGKKTVLVDFISCTPHLAGRTTQEGKAYSPQIMNIKIGTKMITKTIKNDVGKEITEEIPQAIVIPFGKKGMRTDKRGIKIINWDLWEEWKNIKDNKEHEDYENIKSKWEEFNKKKWSWYDFKTEMPRGTMLKIIGFKFSGCMITSMGVIPLFNAQHLYYSTAGEDYNDDPDELYEKDDNDIDVVTTKELSEQLKEMDTNDEF
jgi:hypothetical protein